jgi:hypothetical protein
VGIYILFIRVCGACQQVCVCVCQGSVWLHETDRHILSSMPLEALQQVNTNSQLVKQARPSRDIEYRVDLKKAFSLLSGELQSVTERWRVRLVSPFGCVSPLQLKSSLRSPVAPCPRQQTSCRKKESPCGCPCGVMDDHCRPVCCERIDCLLNHRIYALFRAPVWPSRRQTLYCSCCVPIKAGFNFVRYVPRRSTAGCQTPQLRAINGKGTRPSTLS